MRNTVTLAFVLAALAVVAFFAGVAPGKLAAMGAPDVVVTLHSNAGDAGCFILLCLLAVLSIRLGANAGAVMASGTPAVLVVLTLDQIPLVRYLALAATLFSIGVYGMVVSRNAVRVLISIELMLNAVNINLVAFARYIDPGQVIGQVFTIFTLTTAAAEAAVGLAIVLAIYKNLSTVDMEKFNLLKW